jgi:hypothetical protein
MTDAPLVTFLDSDDLIHPEKSFRQATLLTSHTEYDLAVCQMAHFEDNPNEAVLLWNTFEGPEPRSRFLVHDPVWGIHAPLWRREAVERIGGFQAGLSQAQDFEFHARALVMGCKPLLHRDLLAYARKHAGPTIGSTKTKSRTKTILDVLTRLYGLIEKPSEGDRTALTGDYLWLATLAASQGSGDVMAEALSAARALDGRAGFGQFAFLCRLCLITRRGRFFTMARARAGRMGHDLGARERWFMNHRIENEPGLVVRPMPG